MTNREEWLSVSKDDFFYEVFGRQCLKLGISLSMFGCRTSRQPEMMAGMIISEIDRLGLKREINSIRKIKKAFGNAEVIRLIEQTAVIMEKDLSNEDTKLMRDYIVVRKNME